MRLLLLVGMAVGIMSGSAQASTVNLITNGSFEEFTGSLNSRGWKHLAADAIDGWTGDPNVEIQSKPTLNITPQDLAHYIELDTSRNASIYQTVTLDAGSYALSFWYRPRVNNAGGDNNNMYFAFEGADGDPFWNISGAPNSDYPINEWTQVTRGFSVANDDTAVKFTFAALGPSGRSEGENCGNCGALIDNVHLAAVPLPASALLLMAGMGGLAAMRRRKTTG